MYNNNIQNGKWNVGIKYIKLYKRTEMRRSKLVKREKSVKKKNENEMEK